MDRARRCQPTAIQVKRFDPKHSSIELRVCFQKFAKRAAWYITTARQGDVGVPWTQFRFDSDGERRFLDTFVELKQMRMTGAGPDPDYFDSSFRRKCSNAFHGKEECAKFDRAQFFTQRKFDVFSDVREEAQSEVQLIASCPANASNLWGEIGQDIPDRFWRID